MELQDMAGSTRKGFLSGLELYHYHYNIISELNTISYLQSLHFKPTGFWFSIDESWKEWCEENEFKIKSLAYKHKVTLKETANILLLEEPEQLVRFTVHYRANYLPTKIIDYIDWPRLATEYDGIIITPYQYSCRYEPMVFWYYGWDCACGCIWNIDAVESIELIPQSTQHSVG